MDHRKPVRVSDVLAIVRDDLDRVNDRALRAAADRGTMVHDLCFKHIRNLPLGTAVSYYGDEDGRQALGYLESFAAWWNAESVKTVVAIEPELTSYGLGVVGHPDLILEDALWDIKTPQTPSWKWRLQLSAYLHLAIEDLGSAGWQPEKVGCLMLDPNGGRAREVLYTDADIFDGFARFLECLNLHRAMKGKVKL